MTTPMPMQGFPPSSRDQVSLANWRTPPFCHWAFHHVREVIPTAAIPTDRSRQGTYEDAQADLSAFSVPGLDGEPLDLAGFLADTTTDGLVVLKDGRRVFTHYAQGLTQHQPHILMSVSKSLLGLVAGILADDGSLDLDADVLTYLPEVKATAFAGARIRDLLDMRAGISFSEDYLATGGAIIAYRKATNWNPLEPGESASDLRSFFGMLTERDGDHG
ncbi:MAG: serine hydrolase, partial [Pseudomonadota bacterium]